MVLLSNRVLFRVAVALLALAVVVLWLALRPGERGALQTLPPSERQEIFTRELENFRALCGPTRRTDALEDRCHERAGFVLDFPECDADCRALIEPHLRGATR